MWDADSNLELFVRMRDKVAKHGPCSGTGKRLVGEELVNCECLEEALFQYRLAQSGIPPKYRTLGFKDYVYKEGDAYKKIQDYLAKAQEYREKGIGLFLYGPSYTGKSLLACSLLMELMRRGFDCRYYFFGGLLDEKDSVATIRRGRWDFLCIDGVSDVLNRATNFREGVLTGERIHAASELLAQVISARIMSGLPIIITSEVPLSEMNKSFPGLVNALIGSVIVVQCEDKGFRQRRLEQMMETDK